MLDGGEAALQLGDQGGVGAAGEDLGDEGAAGPKHLDREGRARLDQAHGAQMIGLRMADRIGRHVGKDEVGRAAQRLAQPAGRLIGHEVHLKDSRAGDRIGGQQIDADDRCLRQALSSPPASSRPARCRDRRFGSRPSGSRTARRARSICRRRASDSLPPWRA